MQSAGVFINMHGAVGDRGPPSRRIKTPSADVNLNGTSFEQQRLLVRSCSDLERKLRIQNQRHKTQ